MPELGSEHKSAHVGDVQLFAGGIAGTEQHAQTEVVGRIGLTNIGGHIFERRAEEAEARSPATIDVLGLEIGKHHILRHGSICEENWGTKKRPMHS